MSQRFYPRALTRTATAASGAALILGGLLLLISPLRAGWAFAPGHSGVD